MVAKTKKVIGLFLKDLKVEEETSVKRLETPYKIEEPKASYAFIDGKYFRGSDLQVFLNSVTDFGSDIEAFRSFATKFSYNFLICEAYIDIVRDKIFINVDNILKQDNYDELLKIKRIPKKFTKKIAINKFLYEPIVVYEANELYFGAFLEINNYKKDEPKLEKFYFIKSMFDKGEVVPFKTLPNQEKKYIEEQLEKKEYQDYLNKLMTTFKNSKKSIDDANLLHEKKLASFKKANKDLLKIINSYYQDTDILKQKYENLPYTEYNYEKNYIDDIKIMINSLSLEEKELLKEEIASEDEIINRLNNIQTYLTNLKARKGQKISNTIGGTIGAIFVVVLVIVCIVSVVTNEDDEKNYDQEICRSYTDAYHKCHYSSWEKRCVCESR